MIDWIGWVATAVFASSYLCSNPHRLRLVQAMAALLWLSYGILIKAPPVIAANLIVALLALASSFKRRSAAPEGENTATS
jgi:hypothetical protein